MLNPPPWDKVIYARRHHIEWLINRLKQAQRIAIRYEKRGRELSRHEPHRHDLALVEAVCRHGLA